MLNCDDFADLGHDLATIGQYDSMKLAGFGHFRVKSVRSCDYRLHRPHIAYIWRTKSTVAVGFPRGDRMDRAQSDATAPGVVHSLIKDFFMRKIVLAAAAVAGVFALSACKGEEAAPAATEAASEEAAPADAGTEASTEAAAEATTAAAE